MAIADGSTMNPALWSAAVGLIGSLVGGASTFAASWFTQRGQLRTHTLVQQSAKREALYAEFIIEARAGINTLIGSTRLRCGHTGFSIECGHALMAISTMSASCSREAPSLARTAMPRESAL